MPQNEYAISNVPEHIIGIPKYSGKVTGETAENISAHNSRHSGVRQGRIPNMQKRGKHVIHRH